MAITKRLKLKKSSKREGFAHGRFSRANLVIFAIIFAAIGGYFIYSSFAASSCTVTSSSISDATSKVASAAPGDVVCLSAGTYGAISLSSSHTGDVTLQPVPGSTVTIGAVDFLGTAKHIVLHNFYVTGGTRLEAGSSFITIDHNDITGGGFGVIASSCDSSVPDTPAGCGPLAPITDITISGNKIHGYGNNSGGQDAIQIKNYARVHVTANEFYDNVEDGNHVDNLQSTYGGSDLTFDHNYEHDNQAEGFFLKDGRVTNVIFDNNLFIRNTQIDPTHGLPGILPTYDVAGTFTMTNNTVWSGSQAAVFGGCSGWNDIEFNHNVIPRITADSSSNTSCIAAVTHEDYNDIPSNDLTTPGAHSVSTQPSFVDTSGSAADPYAGDWRLTSSITHGGSTYNAGVTWKPSDYVYGPTDGTATPPPPPTPPPSSDTTPPTVSLTAPTGGSTVSNTATVSANASDNIGVSGVQFKLDGANLGSEDTSSPYSISWDTTLVTNGSHTLTALARDAAGNTTTSTSVTVTVSNATSCSLSSSTWSNHSFTTQTSNFTFDFDATPQANNIDSVTGLGSGAASDYPNLAVIVRFNSTGTIDAVNGSQAGGNYTADASVSYTANTAYHFKVTVNPTTHTYSVVVTPAGGSATTIATNYPFRSEQATLSSFNNWATDSLSGSHKVCNAAINASGSAGKTGDINKDGSVDIFDLSILLSNYNTSTANCDLNTDGNVNIFDLSILLTHYGT